MQGPYRDLIKHSAIYGAGQILSRLASFILLPVYTSYLLPYDYGIIAILDLVAGVFSVFLGNRMGAAVNRYHFKAESDTERNQVWWTGLTFVLAVGTVIVIPALLGRRGLAGLALGPTVADGGYYFALVLVTCWISIIGQYFDGFLRVYKWSTLSVGVNLTRLTLNICLNIAFLAIWDLGIEGILIGNLIANTVFTAIQATLFLRNLGPFTVGMAMLRKLWAYGSPLILTALLAFLMHQVDRYLLNLYLDLSQVGIYSLASTIAQAVNTMWLLPFSMVWNVVVFEVANQPNAKDIYVNVFKLCTYGLSLLLFGVALFAKPLLSVMAGPQYIMAADLIPIVCLGYFFFSLHEHFKIPAMLANRTTTLVPAYIVALGSNLAANLLLIPLYGAAGAAWVTIITFSSFSFFGLYRYRQIDRYDYPFKKCGLAVLGMVCSYSLYFLGRRELGESIEYYCIGIFIWIMWCCILLGPTIRQTVYDGSLFGLKIPFPMMGSGAGR